ncbi:hypothetical protein DAPPUDRAFT_250559 [Daphnia pulex]|uniref:Uncharacterized protein n=1 Tax=Daphnia pulex TaxID=6669 RepID=E9GYT8_DAPPU|nr:hypothetical protein DAPPUDRAFT_250559 [Daphnia pulex]|eukprot:EFX75354.1 hypothetical protein DAPPUDRAFT_250559 [Daphnia pulex]
MTAFEGGEFFKGRVQSSDGGEAFVFITPKLLPEMSNTTELQADGTFDSLPALFKQLFTIHISRFGQILSVYDELYPDVYLNVERLISVFKRAIQDSCKQAFMGCECVGFWFHYGQAIWRKVQKYGLQCSYRTRKQVRQIIKELIVLALLPADDIHEDFRTSKSTIEGHSCKNQPRSMLPSND